MIKRIFITGLAAIIPIVITAYIIYGLFSFADGIVGNYINKYLNEYFSYEIPGLGIILSILIIFVIGLLVHISRTRLFRWTARLLRMFLKLPLIDKIYPPIKRIVDFLFFPPKKKFKNAVLVEYPRRGIYSIGFLTNESYSHFEEKVGKKLYNIFIPSSPSPLTGFTIIVEESELIFLDVGVDAVIKMIVSGGLLNPQ
ncbi:MAG: DUF502 domain-containing protein [Candidatus Omnitrophota bacterium]|nr:MAG: DUF502 domain-containing protein [Candidatus Omnitrophota bacterium]